MKVHRMFGSCPGSYTNDMPICNTLMTCLLNIAIHRKRTKQKGCPVGSTYFADIHVVGGNMMMAHDKSQQRGGKQAKRKDKVNLLCQHTQNRWKHGGSRSLARDNSPRQHGHIRMSEA